MLINMQNKEADHSPLDREHHDSDEASPEPLSELQLALIRFEDAQRKFYDDVFGPRHQKEDQNTSGSR